MSLFINNSQKQIEKDVLDFCDRGLEFFRDFRMDQQDKNSILRFKQVAIEHFRQLNYIQERLFLAKAENMVCANKGGRKVTLLEVIQEVQATILKTLKSFE